MKTRKHAFGAILVVSITIFLLSSCSNKNKPTAADTPPTPVLRIAVLPTATALTSDSRSIVYRQSMSQMEEQGVKAGATVLDMLLTDALSKRANMKLVGSQEMDAIVGSFTGNQVEAARQVGQKTGADAVLITRVQRYNERHGSTYAADNPASVAFSMHLIDTASGRVLCAAAFDETQQSLTDNLFSFAKVIKRGFRWMTAEDLAREGVNKKLQSCAYLALPH